MNNLLYALIAAKLAGGGGGGGEVTAAAVASAIGDMNATQRAQALDDLGGEPQKIVVSVTKSGSNYSVDKTYAQINAAYQAGASVVFSYGGTAIANFDDSGIEDAFVVEICNYVSNGPELVIIAVTESDTVVVGEYLLQKAPTESTVSGATPSVAAADNRLYNCGEVTTLTITSLPATGLFTVMFTSGSTATQIVWPQGAVIAMPDGQTIEANKLYELSVRCCGAGNPVKVAVGEWPVPSAQGAA